MSQTLPILRMLGGRLGLLTISVILCLGLFLTASANASTITVGQLAQPNNSSECTGRTILQTGDSSGTTYTVPVAGVITSWSFWEGGAPVSGLELKVARPAGGVNFTIIGQAAAGPQSALFINGPYPTDIPVQPGDVIGIYSASGNCLLATGNGEDRFVSKTGDIAPGTVLVPDLTGTGVRIPVSVQVQPQPGISLIGPSSGPTAGGTSVTIAGHDFTGASAVSFGGKPAQSFTVNSDTSITAVAPAAAAGTVDVTVTTVAGQSPVSSADQFTYVSPAPAGIDLISPTSGPRTGGTTVTIAGHGFTGATGVRFGGNSAKSFTVISDNLITAVSPAESTGTVDITVINAGGQSPTSSADRFRFIQVCVVPRLKGKSLKAAKKALKNAHCSLGQVKPRGQTSGKFKHESPRQGTILPVDSKVNITLAKARKPR